MAFSALEGTLADDGSDPSENVAEDIVEFARGSVIANEQQALLTILQYSTGWLRRPERYVNSVLIGPAAGGKTLVQGAATDLLPSQYTYSTTNASDNALIDDPEWDNSLVAPLDEYDKIGKPIREYMKSMAGEDGGYTKKRNVEDDEAAGGYSPATVSSMAMPFQFLYAPRGGKGGIDHELQSRMLKLFVDDNRFIREAIGRKEFGHERIDVQGLENTYIFQTTNIENTLRSHFRRLPTKTIQKDDEDTAQVGASHAEMEDWVWYACRPIFDEKPTQTNRTFGMVANLMAASAVLNHHARETVQVERDGDEVEAYLVEPQDVVNVLSCQPTLLATTHNLNPRKRDILDGVSASARSDGTTTVEGIKDWLEDNDKAAPGKSTLRDILEDLSEDYFIRIRENAGENGAHLYEWRAEGNVQPPRLFDLQKYAGRDDVDLADCHVDVSDPFEGTVDPIRDQPFKTTVESFQEMFASDAKTMSAADVMGDSSSDDTEETQATLTETTDDTTAVDVDRERDPEGPIEETVYNHVEDYCGTEGDVFAGHHTVAHYMGFVDTDDDLQRADLEGTPLDPDHDTWDHPSIDDERVRTIEDAKRELSDAFDDLLHDGVVGRSDENTPTGFVEVFSVEQ